MSNGNYPSMAVTYQGVHALIGYSTVLTFTLFERFLWGVALVIAGAAIKEFLYDCFGPEQDSAFNSLIDFTFYIVGAGFAVAVVGISLVALR